MAHQLEAKHGGHPPLLGLRISFLGPLGFDWL